jgi:hypothetical protein
VTLDRLQAALNDDATPAWLRQGLGVWLRAGGAVRLETALRLPRSRAELRRARRNAWLRLLATHFGGDPAAVHAFVWSESWRWRQWRERYGGPPDRATPQEVAAYYCWRFGMPRSVRQVANVLRNSDAEKLPECGGMVEPGLLEDA